ncbi:unnamed protein product [Onchocerca ochengi]|uniref:Alpha-1,2-Mannosidase n=1 Tax=Onchocerca ochengi TaxID=42157 RepID=A0A182EQJ9_ONCOC|nr:unnamed protein product [Onchocerca ochengi]
MDSFVLSETLKYLYMIFTDPSDLQIDLDNYVLTTEAHFIPLSIADTDNSEKLPRRLIIDPDEIIDDENAMIAKKFRSACPTVINEKHDNLPAYAEGLRNTVQNIVSELAKNSESTNSCPGIPKRLSAWSFSPTNVEHLRQLKQMGIQMEFQVDGHVHLTHSPDSGEANEFTTETELAESDNMLNSICMLDNTASVKKQANIYIVHSSHAAVTQLLSMIMLVVLLWLSVMIVAMVVVCVVVCGYRIMTIRRSTSNPINADETNTSDCVEMNDDDDYETSEASS